MFALVGQVERAFRGREAFQEIDQAATIGGLAAYAAEPTDAADVPAAVGDAVRAGARSAGPARSSSPFPEDLLDEVAARRARSSTPSRPAPARPEPDDVRAVLQFARDRAERPVILAGGGVLRARTSTDLAPARRAARRPGHRRLAPRRRHLERPPALPRHGRLRRPARRPRAARARPTRSSSSAAGCPRSPPSATPIPAPGQRWTHVDVEPLVGAAGPRAARAHGPRRRPGVPPGRGRAARGGRPRRRGCRRPARRQRRADRAAWEAATAVDEAAWDGPGRPSRPRDRDAPAAPARRRDRRHRRRQLRAVARPPLPVPPARARSSGRRPARWATPCRRRSPPRSSIATGRSSRSPATAASR